MCNYSTFKKQEDDTEVLLFSSAFFLLKKVGGKYCVIKCSLFHKIKNISRLPNILRNIITGISVQTE